ncbi:MAG: neocarzinostatin apoprotein domain-containing protein, partial [Acidimicrobiales bacterium]
MTRRAARLAILAALMFVAVVAVADAAGGQEDPPVVLPNVVSMAEGDGGLTQFDVPVSLSASSTETVTVQWNTITMPLIHPALQAEEDVDYQVAGGQVTFLPGDTDEIVSIMVDGDTDPERDELIVVQFHDPTNATVGGFFGLGVGVIVNDDGPLTPSIDIAPGVGLNGGDVITISGRDWRPNYTVGVCQADAVAHTPPESGCRAEVGGGPVYVGTDAYGWFSRDYRVDRWIHVGALGAFIDCADPATPCVLGAGEINSGVPDGPIVSVPLPFADPPAPPVTRGTVTVTPSTGVTNFQTLTVTGSGFRADAQIEVYPCVAQPTVPSDCANTLRVDTTADAAGAFQATLSAPQFILGNDCVVASCAVGAAEAVDFVGTLASAPVAFAQPPPVVLPMVASVVEGDAPSTVTVDVPVELSAPSSNTVTVQWETFVVPELDSALQAEPGADYVADSGVVTFVPDDVDEMVSIEVNGDAVGENDELIVVRFHSPTDAVLGGFYGLGVGVIVDDDERVLTVTPNSDLDGGDLVTLAGSGWAPGSTVAACQADAQPAEPAVNACLSGQFGAVTTTVAPDGTISVPYRVRRQGFVAARG